MTVLLLILAGFLLGAAILGALDGWRQRVVERQNEMGAKAVFRVSGKPTGGTGLAAAAGSPRVAREGSHPTDSALPPSAAFTSEDFDRLMAHLATRKQAYHSLRN